MTNKTTSPAKPSDLDSVVLIERYVIGAIAQLGQEALSTATEILHADFFGDEACRTFFNAAIAVNERGEPLDEATIATEVAKLTGEDLEAVYDVLDRWSAAAVGSESSVKGWAERVADGHAARLVRAAGQNLAHGSGDVGERVAQTLKAATVAAELLDRKTTVISASEMMERTIAAIENASKADGVVGVQTGLDELDSTLSGLREGQLIIVAARPSQGKTALALSIAHHASVKQGIPSLVFSLEMGAGELGMRLLSMESNLKFKDLREGRVQARDVNRLKDASSEIADAPITTDEDGGVSFMKIAARARRWRKEIGEDTQALIVIDYLQLVDSDNANKKNANKSELVGDISRGLKQLARELKLPVICLSQLNRDVEKRQDKRPQMADLRDSGAIEQDADVIMFVYRDEMYNPASPDKGTAEIIIAKQRAGSLGTVRLTYRNEYTQFVNLAADPMAGGVRHFSEFATA